MEVIQSHPVHAGISTLIVCHVGVGIGLGHLTRSLVVAHALRQNLGAEVQLLIQGNRLQHSDLDEFVHHFLTNNENLVDSIWQEALRIKARIVVFDLHPRLLPENIDWLFENLRQLDCKTIGVDSLVSHHAKLDLAFVPSFRLSPCEGLNGTERILFGWDCFLLNIKCGAPQWQPGNRVLALTGGSDTTDLGKTFPALLNKTLSRRTELHWTTGPYARQPTLPATPRFSFLNHQAPSRLDDLMIGTNYAITIYGVSLFELLHYGIPTVVFSPYGSKDDEELALIAEAGIALIARDEVEAADKLKVLMTDNALAASISSRAKQKLSVLGGNKFARAVAGLLV